MSCSRGDRGHEGLRIGAEPNHQSNEYRNGGQLSGPQIEFLVMLFVLVLSLAEKSSLIEPKHVGRRQDYANSSPDTPREPNQRPTLQNQKLTDEVAAGGQADAGEHRDHKCRREFRREVRPTAEVLDVHRASTLFHIAGKNEKRPRRKAMRNHLVNSAIGTLLVEGEDTQHNKAEVADRRIRKKGFHVRLH